MSETNKYEQQAIQVVAKASRWSTDDIRLFTRNGKEEFAVVAVRECALRLEAEDLLRDFIKAVTATVSPHDCYEAARNHAINAMEFLRRPR
jgi:hypothetical protein